MIPHYELYRDAQLKAGQRFQDFIMERAARLGMILNPYCSKVQAEAALGGKGAMGGVVVAWDVASIHNGSPSSGESAEANARLIAAAPDLLEACKQALMGLPDRSGAKVVLQTAIAKAKGEP